MPLFGAGTRRASARALAAVAVSLSGGLSVMLAGAVLTAAPADAAGYTVCPSGCEFSTIQAAITVASPGSTITIGPGTYVENVAISQSVTLDGSGPATVVLPAVSNPNEAGCDESSLCGGDSQTGNASDIMLVQSSNVTIENMTLDGDNPSLTGGIVVNGVEVDARNGIVDDFYSGSGTFLNLTVSNVTVRNVFERGIESTGADYGATFTFDHDTVVNVDGDGGSIAMFNFGGSGVIEDDTVSEASDSISSNWSQGTFYGGNVIRDAASGIHTDNNGGAGGTADVITGNTVEDCTTDGYGIWVFAPYLSPSVDANVVDGCYVGLAVFGSQAAGAEPTFSDNSVDGTGASTTDPAGTYGAYVTTDLLGYGNANASVLLTDNSLEHTTTGLLVTQTEPSDGDAAGGQATVTARGNLFTGDGTGANGMTGTVVDASQDWWGCSSGPNTAGCDTATGTVTFTPWLGALNSEVALAQSQPSVTYGDEQADTFSVTVTGRTGAPAPTGSVEVASASGSGTPICSASLSPGTGVTSTASCTVSSQTAFPVGEDLSDIVASYEGDGDYYGATTAGGGSFSVSTGASSVVLRQSQAVVAYGSERADTFTVTMTGASGGVAPTGSAAVADTNTGATLCSALLTSGSGGVATGSCTVASATAFALGTDLTSVVARYGGDTNYNGSTSSPPQSFTVVPGAPVVTSSSAGDGTVTLHWSAPPARGSPILYYVVTARPKAGGPSSSTYVPASQLFGTVVGLTNGTTYDVTVTAFDIVSGGTPSRAVLLTPAASLQPPSPGYWLATSNGAVFAAGGAPSLGGTEVPSTDPVVGIAATSDGKGYWLVTANGTVFPFGDAKAHGTLPGLGVQVTDVVAIAPTGDGGGYWLIGRDGGEFAFGDARYHGSLPGMGVHVTNVVGMVATSNGGGYWLVGSDGGVFAFGNARYVGSLPVIGVKATDIRAMIPSPTRGGYVLVGSDGGTFVFGSGVRYYGSLPGRGIHVSDIVGLALTPDSNGYWLAGADGATYAFGDGGVFGSPAGLSSDLPVVAIAGD
jgi:hypothetical protein